MKRPAKLDPLPVSPRRADALPLWSQLSVGLRIAIASGRLRPGARLPSTRDLARRLDVSRNTVMTAYDDLTARGLLVGHTGAGSFVENELPAVSGPQAPFVDDSGNRLALIPLL